MSSTTIYRQLDAHNVQESVTAAKTLDASDSGKTFFLPAAGKAITLPAAAAGLHYRFMCSVTTAGANWTVAAAAAVIYGSIELAGAVSAVSAKTTMSLIIAKFLPGDYIELESDGTNWYIKGSIVTAAGLTQA